MSRVLKSCTRPSPPEKILSCEWELAIVRMRTKARSNTREPSLVKLSYRRLLDAGERFERLY